MEEQTKRANIKTLIARKMQKEADQFKTYDVYVPSLDAALVFRKPSDDVLLDTIDNMGDGSTRSIMESMKRLIYLSCDLLQSPELQRELEVMDPFSTVDAIFDLQDIGVISDALTKAFGLDDREEKLKNS